MKKRTRSILDELRNIGRVQDTEAFIETTGSPMNQADLTMDVTNLLITSSVPEPGYYAAIAAGLVACLAFYRRRKQ